ncbi:glycosylase [bacterium]|nr:glycosylase [bacterium]
MQPVSPLLRQLRAVFASLVLLSIAHQAQAQVAPAQVKTTTVTGQSVQDSIKQGFPAELLKWQPIPRSNPVFQGAGGDAWDAKIRERGWIVRDGDSWRLYYTGYNVAKTDLRMLGVAVSTDGLSWSRLGDKPLIDDQWVEDMMIVKHEGQWIMVAEGRDDVAHTFVSSDGLSWRREGPVDIRKADGSPISPGPRGTPFLLFENGVWNLFYERADAGVWLARSFDRKVFTNVSDDPVIPVGPAVYDKGAVALNQILKIDGKYVALLHANETRPFGPYWTTTLAISPDLVKWTKAAANPIVGNNSSSGQFVRLPAGGWRLYTMHPEVRAYETTRD